MMDAYRTCGVVQRREGIYVQVPGSWDQVRLAVVRVTGGDFLTLNTVGCETLTLLDAHLRLAGRRRSNRAAAACAAAATADQR